MSHTHRARRGTRQTSVGCFEEGLSVLIGTNKIGKRYSGHRRLATRSNDLLSCRVTVSDRGEAGRDQRNGKGKHKRESRTGLGRSEECRHGLRIGSRTGPKRAFFSPALRLRGYVPAVTWYGPSNRTDPTMVSGDKMPSHDFAPSVGKQPRSGGVSVVGISCPIHALPQLFRYRAIPFNRPLDISHQAPNRTRFCKSHFKQGERQCM